MVNVDAIFVCPNYWTNTYMLSVLLEEARTKLGMTQEELVDKCGTNKSYFNISKTTFLIYAFQHL